MESIGDEKRIRALFSEVRFADEQEAPSFAATWHRAQSRAIRPHRAFNLPFVTATALLIIALGGLAVWSKYSQPSDRNYRASAAVPADFVIAPTAPPAAEDSGSLVPKQAALRPRRTVQKESLAVAENRKAEEKVKAQAKELASWQSPTASLLNSPSDNLFKSLPQLNENANEMKSFLPNRANEKEK